MVFNGVHQSFTCLVRCTHSWPPTRETGQELVEFGIHGPQVTQDVGVVLGEFVAEKNIGCNVANKVSQEEVQTGFGDEGLGARAVATRDDLDPSRALPHALVYDTSGTRNQVPCPLLKPLGGLSNAFGDKRIPQHAAKCGMDGAPEMGRVDGAHGASIVPHVLHDIEDEAVDADGHVPVE